MLYTSLLLLIAVLLLLESDLPKTGFTFCHAWTNVYEPTCTRRVRRKLTALCTSPDTKKNDANDSSTVPSRQKGLPALLPEENDLPQWVLALRRWQPRPDLDAAEKATAPLVSFSNKTYQNITTVSIPSLMSPLFQKMLDVQDVLPPFTATSVLMTRNGTTRNFLDLLEGTSPATTADGAQVTSSSSLTEEVEAILDSLQDSSFIVNVSSAVNTSHVPTTTDWWDDGWNRWDRWVYSMQQSLSQASAASNLTTAAEGILRKATLRLENLLSDVQPMPMTLQAVVEVANATAMAAAAAESLDLNVAVERAQELAQLAGQVSGIADGLMQQGYVASSNGTVASDAPPQRQAQGAREGSALFADFLSATEVDKYTPILGQAAEMAILSGAIYEETIPRTLQLGHSVVARGISLDVKWMITDSLASHSALELYNDRIDNDPSEAPISIRTITIRGFDASDEEVDRETLVTEVCRANSIPLGKGKGIKVHAGLWRIAKAIYNDVKQYIDWTTPQHKLVLNGHSIGGSLANLVLFLLTLEQGPDFVQERVLRVYTFGSPPVVALSESKNPQSSKTTKRDEGESSLLQCDVLETMALPVNLVWAFVQPWDPISRLFSDIDPLYPLVDGMMSPDSDGVTPWPKGPPRTLRPITKAIFEAWDGWPRFRDTYYEMGSQSYRAVGIQHILLPEATRYLTDRFLTVSIAVPPVRSVLRMSSTELYPALVSAFPLDVFEISYVPQAIRSFVHHFYPAYGFPFVEYVRLLENRAEPILVRDNLASVLTDDDEWTGDTVEDRKRNNNEDGRPWGLSGDLLQKTVAAKDTTDGRLGQNARVLPRLRAMTVGSKKLGANQVDDTENGTRQEEVEQNGHWERIGPPIATIQSPWLTVIAERYRDPSLPSDHPLLDYWRLERDSSVIVIVQFRQHYILPAPQFRPGLQRMTLDFVGGRRRPGASVPETAVQLLAKELPMLSNIPPSQVKWIYLNDDEGIDSGSNKGKDRGWPVDSSVSSQKLYGAVAMIDDDALDDDTSQALFEQAGVVTYPVDKVEALLDELLCLQCRVVLLDWLRRCEQEE